MQYLLISVERFGISSIWITIKPKTASSNTSPLDYSLVVYISHTQTQITTRFMPRIRIETSFFMSTLVTLFFFFFGYAVKLVRSFFMAFARDFLMFQFTIHTNQIK